MDTEELKLLLGYIGKKFMGFTLSDEHCIEILKVSTWGGGVVGIWGGGEVEVPMCEKSFSTDLSHPMP